jgi:hypothetical protein
MCARISKTNRHVIVIIQLEDDIKMKMAYGTMIDRSGQGGGGMSMLCTLVSAMPHAYALHARLLVLE